MNKYGVEIDNLQQWADLAYRNGDYDDADFLNEVIYDWDFEVKDVKHDKDDWERRADELAYGMVQIKILLGNLRTEVQQSSRLNRKEILESLLEAIQAFDEYI